MANTYSIAEARNRFAALIRQAEKSNKPVQVTRRGQSVAVILSVDEYDRLLANQPEQDFWTNSRAWRKKWQAADLNIDPDAVWQETRDKTPAPDIDPWP